MSHTPGPWTPYFGSTTDTILVSDSEEHAVVNNFGARTHKGGAGYPEVAANARLISAAPDLLEACKDAESIVSGVLKAHAPDPIWVELAAELRAAIRKAEGNG